MKSLAWLTVALMVSLPAQARPWVVVVGIDDYLNPSVPDLRFACADAKLLAQAAEQLLDVPKERIFRFTSDSLLEQELPRVTNIVYRLDWLRSHSRPEDTILFYFAGHGISAGGNSYLLTEESDNRSQATLQNSALSAAELSRLLGTSPARQTLMLLDACRNFPSQASHLPLPLTQGLSEALSLAQPEQEKATMFSCSLGERSWEWEEQKHGFFTYYLFEGLRHGASLPNGQVTLGSLFDFVSEKVPERTQTVAGARQRPILRYEGPSANRWGLARVQVPADLKPGPQGLAQVEARGIQRDRQVAEKVALQSRLEAEESRRKQLELQVEVLEKQLANQDASRQLAELRRIRDEALQELAETRKKLESALTQSDPGGLRLAEAALMAAEREQLKAENKVLMARIAVLEARAQQSPLSLSREVFLQEADADTQQRWRTLQQMSPNHQGERLERERLELELDLSEKQIQRAATALQGKLKPALAPAELEQMKALFTLERASDGRLAMATNRLRSLALQQKMQQMMVAIASPTDRLRYQELLLELEDLQGQSDAAFQQLRSDFEKLRHELASLAQNERFRSRWISRRYYQINRLPGLGDILDVPIRHGPEAQSY